MIVDLHAHYPMHVVSSWGRLLRRFRSGQGWPGLLNAGRGILLRLASRVRNYRTPFSGPRVQLGYMQEGNVGVALSVLYSYFDEIQGRPGDPPRDAYLGLLLDQLDSVAEDVAEHQAKARREGRPEEIVIARNPAELEAAQRAGKVALIHCVEGGFHLGGDAEHAARAVDTLADKGVAYITLAHLFWRQVATNANALPFYDDEEYDRRYPQPDQEGQGLSEIGRAAVEAMVRRRMLIDVSHMRKRALVETFKALPPDVPVLATHGGYRFGEQRYMLDEETLAEIAGRGGVVGLIFAQHQIYDGDPEAGVLHRNGLRVRKRVRFEESFAQLCRHINEIHRVTGSHRHVAIGSDFDGFIKPTLAGLEDMRDMKRLEEALGAEYGGDAELICSKNAMGLLTGYWGGAPV